GQRLVVFGKPRQRGQRICMEHPEFEVIENDEEISIHFRRITPIYPATEGLSQRVLRSLIYRLLEQSENSCLTNELPEPLRVKLATDPLREIHFPRSEQTLMKAREAIVLGEFFGMQMVLAARHSWMRARHGTAHLARGKLLERFLESLPFALTNAQRRVIAEVRADLATSAPMNRLLQGDVGSGKTVVAIAALLLAVEGGAQAALMAPTQILAEQHYAVLQRWLEPLGISIALRTAARKADPLILFDRANARSGGIAQIFV